jgi:hypothetical protein
VQSLPVHRSILAVDIERSTSPLRTNPIKEELRLLVYRLLGEAMAVAGIGSRHCDPFVDRGDGVLTLIHPVDQVPKTLLLNPLVPELTRLLIDYNLSLPIDERPRRQLRLRVVVHAGEIHCDHKGPFGEELDAAFRLLDAPKLKQCLQQAEGPLVLVVSEEIYQAIVRHRYDGICDDAFHQMVRVHVAGRRRQGWVHIPAESAVLTSAAEAVHGPRAAVAALRRLATGPSAA